MRKITALIYTVAVALLLIGCGTTKLEPGGAYAPIGTNGVATLAPDYEFFVIDSAYGIAHSAMNWVFDYERNNEAALFKVAPNVKHALDKMRPKAVAANAEYHRARDAYLEHPTPAGLDTLRTVSGKFQQLSALVQAIIPNAKN